MQQPTNCGARLQPLHPTLYMLHMLTYSLRRIAYDVWLFAQTGEEAIQWIEDGYIVYPVCFDAETYQAFT